MHPVHPGYYQSCAICCSDAASRLVTNSAIPPAEEERVQVIEVSSDEEEVVEVSSEEEEVVEVPSDEEMIEVPSAEEEAVEVPPDEEEMIEVPSAKEEAVQVIEVPSAVAEEVTMEAKLCCECKSGVEANVHVTCARCTKVHIHRRCLLDMDSDRWECWYCRDCEPGTGGNPGTKGGQDGMRYCDNTTA